MTRNTETETLIIAAMTKRPGCSFNYASVGGYEAARPVLDAMIADGRAVRRVRLSKTGCRMGVLVLSEFAGMFMDESTS